MSSVPAPSRRVAAGTILIAVAWSASWSGKTPLSAHSFFPLWLGYILVVDALTAFRTGTSLIGRAPRSVGWLFACSIPFWWIFEAINTRLQNWHYLLPHRYGWFAYHAEATLAFTTVVPAIFVTAELVATFVPNSFANHWIRLDIGRRGWWGFMVVGVAMLLLVLVLPRLFFPLAWISLFFIIDPLVHLSGGSSIATRVAAGHWRTVVVLFAAGLICGFFWEMWNSQASPKWIYDVPYAARFHLFEMPIAGYGGYQPFALETYAVVKLIDRVFPFLPADGIRFDRFEPENRP